MCDPREKLREIYQETKRNIQKIESKEKLIQGIEYFYTLVESKGLEIFKKNKDKMNFAELEDLLDKLIREVSNRDFINWVKSGKEPELAQKYNLKLLDISEK